MSGRIATRALLFPVAAASLLLTQVAWARGDGADLCLRAAADAAKETGVPFDVLQAIATVETGRQGRPWPWTVNFGGDGHWYTSALEAEASAASAVDQGATNVDLGCFQLNYRWHRAGFASIRDMLDPSQNANYAARYLAGQFARTGDWGLAAAAYHSATPDHAAAYQAKFETVLAGLSGNAESSRAASTSRQERENRFPLLIAGARRSHGSLVPTGPGGFRLIGGP